MIQCKAEVHNSKWHMECGILAFSSKSRVGGTGVPFLSRGRPPGVVHTKAPPRGKAPPRSQDCWAKVRAVEGAADGTCAWELVEILGPVGDAFVEQTVRLCVHRIQPCKYPPELSALSEDRDVAEQDADAHAGADNVDGATGRRFDAYTFDGPGTTDMDDALSYEPPGGPGMPARLGIHVTDTTSLTASAASAAQASDVLYEWARERASSAYPSPMVRGPSRRPVHMLPGNLGSLVAAASTPRSHPCISLVLELEHGSGGTVTVTGTSVVPSARVTIVENAEYARMPAACPEMHAALAALAGTMDPAEQVAWAMVYYNTTFADAFANGAGEGPTAAGTHGTRGCDPIYRVLEEGDGSVGARYSRDAGAGHSAFGGKPYVHMTSPMRRFADLHNQRVFKGMLALPRSPVDLDALNARMDAVRAFHREDAVACLAYACRDRPRRVVVEAVRGRARGDDGDDDGTPALSVRLALVQDGGGGERVGSFRLPLHDSYYAEPLAQKLHDGGRHEVELHGVIRQGRAQLRIRLMDDAGGVDIGGVERKVGHMDGRAS